MPSVAAKTCALCENEGCLELLGGELVVDVGREVLTEFEVAVRGEVVEDAGDVEEVEDLVDQVAFVRQLDLGDDDHLHGEAVGSVTSVVRLAWARLLGVGYVGDLLEGRVYVVLDLLVDALQEQVEVSLRFVGVLSPEADADVAVRQLKRRGNAVSIADRDLEVLGFAVVVHSDS